MHKERYESDLAEKTAAKPKMPAMPPQPKKETLNPQYKKPHSTYPPHMPDDATVAREIEQLRSMVDDRYEQ